MLLSLAGASHWVRAQDYNSKGKRDPFLNLGLRKEEAPKVAEPAPPPLQQRPAGLAGLLVSEVSVAGTASNKSTKIVILKGADNFTYFARVGSKLYDGYLEDISGDQVTFVREVVDAQGHKRITRVVKRLYTEDQVKDHANP